MFLEPCGSCDNCAYVVLFELSNSSLFCFFLRNKTVTLTKAECTVSEFFRKNTFVSIKVYLIFLFSYVSFFTIITFLINNTVYSNVYAR